MTLADKPAKTPAPAWDSFMQFSEDGMNWLPYREWLMLIYRNYPERLRNDATQTTNMADDV